MAVLGSNGAAAKESCGSAAGCVCVGEDFRPVRVSQLYHCVSECFERMYE